jgi:hypothetical protein
MHLSHKIGGLCLCWCLVLLNNCLFHRPCLNQLSLILIWLYEKIYFLAIVKSFRIGSWTFLLGSWFNKHLNDFGIGNWINANCGWYWSRDMHERPILLITCKSEYWFYYNNKFWIKSVLWMYWFFCTLKNIWFFKVLCCGLHDSF